MQVTKIDTISLSTTSSNRGDSVSAKSVAPQALPEAQVVKPEVTSEHGRSDLGQDKHQSMLRSYPNDGHSVEVIMDTQGNVEAKYPPQAIINKYQEQKAQQNLIMSGQSVDVGEED